MLDRLRSIRLLEFMEALYRGEFPQFEFEAIARLIESAGGNPRSSVVHEHEVVQAVESLRKLAEAQIDTSVYEGGSGSEFSSNKLMRERRFKHIRLKRQPDEKYSQPVTTSMSVSEKCALFPSSAFLHASR